MPQRRPVPGGNVRPCLTGIRNDSIVYKQSLVAFRSSEAGPQRSILIAMRREWLHGVTKALETIRRRMQLSCSFSNPAHDDFALAVGEPHHSPGKVRRKRFLNLVERQRRQRLAFKRAGPTGEWRRFCYLRARYVSLEKWRHKRRPCRYHTRDYVADIARTHSFLLLSSITIPMIPAASSTNAITPAYSWPHEGAFKTPASM